MMMGRWINTCRTVKLDSYLTPLTKTNSKWITDLNIKPNNYKTQQKHRKLLNIVIGSDFLDVTPKVHAVKAKISKWDYIKLECFSTAKSTPDQMKKQQISRKNLQTMYQIRDFISKIYKKLKNKIIQLTNRQKTKQTFLQGNTRLQ